MAEIKVTYENNQVVYNTDTRTWTYMGIGETAVKALSEPKYNAIIALLEKEVTEYQDRIKKEEEDKKAREIEERRRKIQLFIDEVTPLIPAGFEYVFAKPDVESFISSRWVRLKKGDYSAAIEYDNHVYRGRFHSSTTEMVWEVNIGKRKRFYKLEQAVTYTCKQLDEKIKEQKKREEIQVIAQNKKDTTAKILADVGFKLENEYHHSYGRPGYGYYVQKAVRVLKVEDPIREYSAKITISGSANLVDDNTVKVSNLCITGTYTLEQVNRIVNFINEINPAFR